MEVSARHRDVPKCEAVKDQSDQWEIKHAARQKHAKCEEVALIPNIPLIKMLVWIQVLNGALLPIILVFILLLINYSRLVGHLKNTRFYDFLGWGTFAMITFGL